MKQYQINKKKIEIVEKSITEYPADAVVFPRNGFLFPINKKELSIMEKSFLEDGGEDIFNQSLIEGKKISNKIKYFNHTIDFVLNQEAYITKAGNLDAHYIIHSVFTGFNPKATSPEKIIYSDEKTIENSVKNVLDLANENNIKFIGFPSLKSGTWGVENADEVMLETFNKHLRTKTSIYTIGLVCASTSLADVLKSRYKSAIEIADSKFIK